jgi:glycosyltransferase involved in cell wall biosynthesis
VVIPSFNNAAHIDATVRSVLAQTFEDFELIISDHGSEDGTEEILRPFLDDPRVRLVSISPGGGASRNWNHVTSLARGELLKLVCGDDLIEPRCLALQVQAFDEHGQGVVLAACQRSVVDRSGRTVVRRRGLRRLSGRVPGGIAARAAVRSGTNIFGEPCCVMFRRQVLEDAGLWEGTHGYVIDLATYLKVLRGGDLVAIREPLASFRLSAGQWSVALEEEQERQVHEFRRRVHRSWPQQFTWRDRVQGALMTKTHTLQRKLAYRVLSSRM